MADVAEIAEADPVAKKAPATKKATGTAKSGTRKKAATKAPTRRGKLVIVESSAKAKSIQKYLGDGWKVIASFGHVRDLLKSRISVDIANEFAPYYAVPRDKLRIVKDLKAEVAKAKEVYLATDPDREGEAIAWHILALIDAGDIPVHRVTFYEITPAAVREAIDNPRPIDQLLVDAQQARRILDRLVGYQVSPLLWKKVKRGLSAGRVQTVALRIVCEREREVLAFEPVEYWTIDADLAKQLGVDSGKSQFRVTLKRKDGEEVERSIGNQAQADQIVLALNGALYRVASVKVQEKRRFATAPFTTSTLQQEASRKLGFNVKRTMSIAQNLYEGIVLGPEGPQGLITYMRTDSTNVASVAQQAAAAVISQRYGPEYVPAKPNFYKTRSKGAQEAHEAIRPTSPERTPEMVKPYLDPSQFKLYQLIWQRFIASQMLPYVYDQTTVDVAAGAEREIGSAESAPFLFRAVGSVEKFAGFRKVYMEGHDEGDAEDDSEDKALPKLTEGEMLDLRQILPVQHFTEPPPRFSEASLVKALEEYGIGRPSTYAPTITTLQARGYVSVEAKKLIPTELGFTVNDKLIPYFEEVFNVGFTSKMEEQLDEIAEGKKAWVEVLRDFYGMFGPIVETAGDKMEKEPPVVVETDIPCDKCGRMMVIRLSRYGKFLACPGFPDCRNTKPLTEPTGVMCPECKEGEIVERRSKKGRVFYGCNRYPDCEFTLWDKPVPVPCPTCGAAYVVETTKKDVTRCLTCNPMPVRTFATSDKSAVKAKTGAPRSTTKVIKKRSTSSRKPKPA